MGLELSPCQKIHSKMYAVFCTNTHNDDTDLVYHRMVKNTKTWTSQEWNITFLWNKKILNLHLRWQILRSYCFVVEITFKLHNLFWIIFWIIFWGEWPSVLSITLRIGRIPVQIPLGVQPGFGTQWDHQWHLDRIKNPMHWLTLG